DEGTPGLPASGALLTGLQAFVEITTCGVRDDGPRLALDNGARFFVGETIVPAAVSEVLHNADGFCAVRGNLRAKHMCAERFGSAEVDRASVIRGRSFAHWYTSPAASSMPSDSANCLRS